MAEHEKQFSDVNEELLNGIQACSLTSDQFLSEPHLSALALHYHIDLKSEEVIVAKNYLRRKREACAVEDMLSMYNLLEIDMFPTLKALFQVALTIPVRSCSCERSFSALCRLHTWLRGTMRQNRLNHLAVIRLRRRYLRKSNDRFATLKIRRNSLVLPK